MLYSADRRLVEAAESTETTPTMRTLKVTGTRPGRALISTLTRHGGCHNTMRNVRQRALSRHVEVKAAPAETLRGYESLTVAPEHMDVQLLKDVHDERVDLWQQPHEEDDGETQSEDCRETNAT